MKKAYDSVDDLYFREVNPFKVNELGLTEKELLIDLEVKDTSFFWLSHERSLWLILSFCSFIFLRILFFGVY